MLVPACLELLNEVGRRLECLPCEGIVGAERRADRLGFVWNSSDIDCLEARMVRINVHADHPTRMDADDVRAQAHAW